MTLSGEILIDPGVSEAAQHLAAGDAVTALSLLAPLVAAEPPSLPPRFLLAMTAWQMSRLDWAIDLMRQCHELWPMNGPVAEALASLHAQSGNLVESLFMGKVGTALGGADGALAALVPEQFPPFDFAFFMTKERPLLAQAKLGLADGKLDQALDKARQHVALDPGDREGLAFLAVNLLRAGEAGAVVAALRLTADEPDIPATLTSLYARGLAACGETEEARRRHDQAAACAPNDAAIAALSIADGAWLASDAAELGDKAADWVRRFCPPPKPRQWRRPDGKIVIAYLVSALADPRDAAAAAALALAHDRSRVRVVGYGSGAQSAPDNAALGHAFDAWRDVAALDAPTLARFFARDEADIIVDASGFAAPRSLMALARTPTAVRLGWLGDPAGLGDPVYDGGLGAGSFYPVPHDLRHAPRSDHAGVQFGADVGLAQLDAETVAAWSEILAALPDAKLLLRAHDMSGDAVDRLIAHFGRALAARIDVVTAERVDEFYARIDVALAPRRGLSPRLAAEAVACFVPPVAFDGARTLEPYSGFLRGIGLGDALVAGRGRGYVEIALNLARSGDERAGLGRLMSEAAAAFGPAALARTLEARALRLMTELAA